MLRAIHELGNSYTFLGLNCGRIGFLLNDVVDPAKMVTRIESRGWNVHHFPRLRMAARLVDVPPNGSPKAQDEIVEGRHLATAHAVNDVYLERMATLSCHIKLAIDGNLVMERMVCDGLVVATSIGSTGYSISAGGSACHPLVHSIHITPICPRSPRLLPIVLPMTAKVELWPLDTSRRPTRAVADWLGFPGVDHLLVEDAKSPVRLAFMSDHDFTATMFRKVLLA